MVFTRCLCLQLTEYLQYKILYLNLILSIRKHLNALHHLKEIHLSRESQETLRTTEKKSSNTLNKGLYKVKV